MNMKIVATVIGVIALVLAIIAMVSIGQLEPGDFPGLPGETGETGPQGEQGIQGLQGIQGELGPAGEQGLAGPRGTRGTRGYTGDDGDDGDDGEPGVSGYEFIISPAMYFSAGGWAGWSCPEGKAVLGGGVFGVETRISCPAFPNSVWPHWTYGADEYGWVAQSDEAGTGYICVICANVADSTVTDMR